MEGVIALDRLPGNPNPMDRKQHWEEVYETKSPDEVSWFQQRPEVSLRLIAGMGLGKTDGIIDVGGGASVLVDFLLDEGYENLTVLDISAAALARARQRVGERAAKVKWIEADVTVFQSPATFALWHDRAVFHFLTTAADRAAYVRTLRQALRPGGHVIIATFAADGPTRCSGLDVTRYDAPGICAQLGAGFELQEEVREVHRTPWQTEQAFSYFRFIRKD
jgi:SAM-dependent methyltransferase